MLSSCISSNICQDQTIEKRQEKKVSRGDSSAFALEMGACQFHSLDEHESKNS